MNVAALSIIAFLKLDRILNFCKWCSFWKFSLSVQNKRTDKLHFNDIASLKFCFAKTLNDNDNCLLMLWFLIICSQWMTVCRKKSVIVYTLKCHFKTEIFCVFSYVMQFIFSNLNFCNFIIFAVVARQIDHCVCSCLK